MGYYAFSSQCCCPCSNRGINKINANLPALSELKYPISRFPNL